MNFYKTAILTLTGAGMLIGCTHKDLEGPILGANIDMGTANGTTKCDLDIRQKIAVRNAGHTKIVVGRDGGHLKQIGTAARHDIQDQWGDKCASAFIRSR